MGDLRPIDEREAANWRRTRPQENTEPAGAEGKKCRENGDATAYGRACNKITRSRNLEVPDRAGSKSLAPANGNFGGKETPATVAWLSGTCCERCGLRTRKGFKNAGRGVRLRVKFANREYIRSIEDGCMY